MPWQHSGVQLKRTWPIAADVETLRRRWRVLLTAQDRGEAFRETGDRVVTRTYSPILSSQQQQKAIVNLPTNAPMPEAHRYAFRSFDRQWIIADGRLMSRPRPELWRIHSDRQVYVTTLLNHPLGFGPALTACAEIPDLHHFRGSFGARETIPLYRDPEGTHPNVPPGLLDVLRKAYVKRVTAEDFLAYLYGVLAQEEFTERFYDELETRDLRVPLTKDANLFEQVAEVGRRLLWLHTFGQRFAGPGRPKNQVPQGEARCTKPVSDKPEDYPKSATYDAASKRLTVDTGTFEPVEPAVWEFAVSGLEVVRSWLDYRVGSGKGKKSSTLDDIRPQRWTPQFTTELLQLLWVLEATLAIFPRQAQLLEQVLASHLFKASELPPVPELARKPPAEHLESLWQEGN